MNQQKSLQEIEQIVKKAFPAIKNPGDEVNDITEQLRESGFF